MLAATVLGSLSRTSR